MGRVIFLLEESSMKAFLLEFLPRLIPGWVHEQHFLRVTHDGVDVWLDRWEMTPGDGLVSSFCPRSASGSL